MLIYPELLKKRTKTSFREWYRNRTTWARNIFSLSSSCPWQKMIKIKILAPINHHRYYLPSDLASFPSPFTFPVLTCTSVLKSLTTPHLHSQVIFFCFTEKTAIMKRNIQGKWMKVAKRYTLLVMR